MQQYFGKLPSVNVAKPKPQKEVAPLGERNIVIKTPAKLPILFMGYNVPTLKTADQKWTAYALEVAQGILNLGASSRLDKDLVRKQQIAASISSNYDFYSRLDNLEEIVNKIISKIPSGTAIAPLPEVVKNSKPVTNHIEFPATQINVVMGQIGITYDDVDYFPIS